MIALYFTRRCWSCVMFQSARSGYRGVIIGWYERCPQDENWVKTWGPFQRGTEQPFYLALIDVRDRPEGMRTLAAEENLELMQVTPRCGPFMQHPESAAAGDSGPYVSAVDASPVFHPQMDQYFDGFHEEGRHLMNDEWAVKYSEDDY